MFLSSNSRKINTHLKYKGHLVIYCNDCNFSEWITHDNKLDNALFRIHVSQQLIEFFQLKNRGNEELVNELLNPYERGVANAIKKTGYLYEHPEYEQGYNDYIDAIKRRDKKVK